MLGNENIKRYFASGTSHYLTPQVSAEWNYNLFHAPYATFAGDAMQVTCNWTSPGYWTKQNCTMTYDTTLGRVASGYSDTSALKMSITGQQGSATLSVPVTAGNDTYKVVFYAKINSNIQATLTALTYVDTHRSNSKSQIIDSTIWTKFEIYVSSKPSNDQYSSFNIILDATSIDTTIASQVVPAPSNYDVLIDQLEIFKTTDSEYLYGNLWPTSSPFGFFRPGESYVQSGNLYTQQPDTFRKISTEFTVDGIQVNDGSYIMPASPVIYHPSVLTSRKGNPLFKNGMLSEYSVYKYFVSEISDQPAVGALYDVLMSVNKLVIKFNTAFSFPTDVTVRISNTLSNAQQDISIYRSDISDSGVCVLYRQVNGDWISQKNGGAWQMMPTFNTAGQITLFQQINKIVVIQNAAETNDTYTNLPEDFYYDDARYARYVGDMQRLQVVEISPRLELDLTTFVMSVDVKAELDNKQNPLPISAISSNSATVNLSNIPFTVSNYVLSLFSNNSSLSPLSGLFKKNVKFYINYLVKDTPSGTTQYDRSIPGGVFYAETWEGQDLQRTVVTCYDITKYLQLLSPTDYVSRSQSAFNVITNILDMSGFTDYDYDSLRKVTMSKTNLIDGTVYENSQPMNSSYFYANGIQQKVFDVLRELFEVYQIGAFIDARGVMKFLSLDNILSNKTANMLLHDSSVPQQITPYLGYSDNLMITSNITEDTYTESVKTKIGKATMRFKIPQVNKTYNAYGLANTNELTTTIVDKFDLVWSLDKETVSTFNYLNKSITNFSQNYFYINPSDMTSTFNSFNLDHDGYVIVEGEVMSFRDKEYVFSTGTIDPVTNTFSGSESDYAVIIQNSTDLSTAVSDFSARAGIGGSVKYTPTGKIANVERGLFNTPVNVHTVISNTSSASTEGSLYSKMEYWSGDYPSVVGNRIIMGTNSPYHSILVAGNDEASSTSNPYNTFSTKIQIGQNSGADLYNGVGGGLVINVDGAPLFVEIRQQVDTFINGSVNKVKYLLYVYYYVNNQSSFSEVSVLRNGTKKIDYIDVTDAVNSNAISYPADSPMGDLSKFVNLKFVNIPNPVVHNDNTKEPAFQIYIDKSRIMFDTESTLNINTSGKFGIFTHSVNQENRASGNMAFTELYATQSSLDDPFTWYHFQTKYFANSIASGTKILELNYMMQTRPQLFGINYYDVQYQYGPAMSAHPLPAPYNWYYYTDDPNGTVGATGNKSQILKSVDVREDSLSYSSIYNSGFRGRLAIVNSSPASIWIKKTPDTKNPSDPSFIVNTDSLITLSSEVTIEKVFDPANISESIEISSNWVQSKNAATGILRNIFRAIDGFSRDTTVSIYGNPLYEVGDVVQVNYSLKNISGQRYFVQGVEQIFDQGLKTVLTLNQIV